MHKWHRWVLLFSSGAAVTHQNNHQAKLRHSELKVNLLIRLGSAVSLETYMPKAWLPAFYWEVVEEKSLGCALKEDIGIAGYFLSLSFHFLFSMKWTAILPHTFYCHGCFHRRPKDNVANIHEPQPRKPQGKQTFPLYKVSSLCALPQNVKLTQLSIHR